MGLDRRASREDGGEKGRVVDVEERLAAHLEGEACGPERGQSRAQHLDARREEDIQIARFDRLRCIPRVEVDTADANQDEIDPRARESRERAEIPASGRWRGRAYAPR